MSNEPTIRLISLVLTAWRIENAQPLVAMRNMIVLSAGEIDLEQEGNQAALSIFPPTDEWKDQKFFATEITQGMMFGPLKLTWSVEEQTGAQNEGAEK
jgi:hypothetical protein